MMFLHASAATLAASPTPPSAKDFTQNDFRRGLGSCRPPAKARLHILVRKHGVVALTRTQPLLASSKPSNNATSAPSQHPSVAAPIGFYRGLGSCRPPVRTRGTRTRRNFIGRLAISRPPARTQLWLTSSEDPTCKECARHTSFNPLPAN